MSLHNSLAPWVLQYDLQKGCVLEWKLSVTSACCISNSKCTCHFLIRYRFIVLAPVILANQLLNCAGTRRAMQRTRPSADGKGVD